MILNAFIKTVFCLIDNWAALAWLPLSWPVSSSYLTRRHLVLIFPISKNCVEPQFDAEIWRLTIVRRHKWACACE